VRTEGHHKIGYLGTSKRIGWLKKDKGESNMLTKKQKEKYLRYPGICPHCESYELTYEKVIFEANKVWHEISCGKCNKKWADIYSLTDVEEIA